MGRFGAWFNPRYSDDDRTEFVVQAESLGFPTAWREGGAGRSALRSPRVAGRASSVGTE